MSISADLQARMVLVRQRVDLPAFIGRRVPKLRRAGREWKACCPFHQETTPSFTVVPEKGFWHCFGCGLHGDAITFLREAEGLSFMDALAAVEAECGISGAPGAPVRTVQAPAPRATARNPKADHFVSSAEAGKVVWNAAIDARGTLAEVYLRARGIDPDASAIMRVIRFSPICPVRLWRRWENWRDARETCPAMLLPICRVEGGRGTRVLVQHGVEVVFLAGDGRSKRKFAAVVDRDGNRTVPPSRKMWGDLQGGAVPIPPHDWRDWRNAEWIDRTGPLVVGEGFESTLSLMARVAGAPAPSAKVGTGFAPGGGSNVRGGFAALSLDNLQGWPRLISVGGRAALPLHAPRPDFERTMFTVADAGAVIIGVDADMSGKFTRWVQDAPRGPVVRRTLPGPERTDLCAALASAQWRAAGAHPVQVVRPPMGEDFNDADQRRSSSAAVAPETSRRVA